MSQELAHFHTYGYDWTKCSLCRSTKQAVDTYNRSIKRKVDWPDISVVSEDPLSDDVIMTHQEALNNIVQLLGATTQCCKSYHTSKMRSAPSSPVSATDSIHYRRYHTPQICISSHRNNTAQITVSLPKGSYSIDKTDMDSQTQAVNNNKKSVLIKFSV
ncbi:A-kinase-interacting protein 1 [Oopsacas minuta]|uniref:A-kinase-interacting protein 1 n=1 Tax=Oopsacas minuta TaxID=111878 RepID=A0AAV7KAD8_9METZ|nr:A-kinase-interacting protein 1 [Oopsacas minuta]